MLERKSKREKVVERNWVIKGDKESWKTEIGNKETQRHREREREKEKGGIFYKSKKER